MRRMTDTESIRDRAHKKGEVVGPAGGETGGPHCLAEVYQPLRGINSLSQRTNQQNNTFRKYCQTKNERTGKIRKVFIIHPTFHHYISIHVLAEKSKYKIQLFCFFYEHRIICTVITSSLFLYAYGPIIPRSVIKSSC